jgi:tetratricopeptide (TPR) repeat protein
MNFFIAHKRMLLVALFCIFTLQSLVNFQVLNKATVARVADEAQYLKLGLLYYYTIFVDQAEAEHLERNTIFATHKLGLHRPPILFVLQAFAWRLIKIFNIWDENAVILIINTLFLLIMLLSCYGIGSILGDSKVGFMSAVLVSCFPLVYIYSRTMMTDIPLTAMLCLSTYILLKTDKFRLRSASIFLGLVLAVSQLIRETFVMYLAIPFIYYTWQSLQQAPRGKVLKNIFACLGLALLISGPLFFSKNNFYDHNQYAQLFFIKQPHAHRFFYFINFPRFLGSLIFIFTIPLFIRALIKFKQTDKVVLLWFLVPAIGSNIFPNQFGRFIMPALPAYALIISCSLLQNRSKPFFKQFYFIAIISACLLQYCLGHLSEKDNTLLGAAPTIHGIRNMYVRSLYFSTHQALLEFFRKEKVKSGHAKRVLALFNVHQILYPLAYKFPMQNMLFDMDTSIDQDPVDAPMPGTVDWRKRLVKADYLIDKVGGFLGCHQGVRENIGGKLKDSLAEHKNSFEEIAKIYVPDDNSYVFIYKNRVKVFIELGITSREQGDLNQSEEYLKQALALNPEDHNVYKELGITSREQGNFTRSEDYFNQALKLQAFDFSTAQMPDIIKRANQDHGVYLEMGRSLRLQNKLVDAKQSLEQSIKINPNNHYAYIELGIMFREQGNFTQSEEYFQKALKLNPSDHNIYKELGITSRGQGNFTQSEEYFQKALTLNPKDCALYIEKSRLLYEQKKFTDAESALQKAIALNPHTYRAHKELGTIYKEQGAFVLADKHFRQARKIADAGNNVHRE